MPSFLSKTLLALAALLPTASAQYPAWPHAGSLFVVTTQDGAALPAAAAELGFPLLVRLDQDWFDFSQTQPGGADLRFSCGGQPLSYQIEEWSPADGRAAIWVRLPAIKGDAQLELRLHWGLAGAVSESRGQAVFNESNGYLAVFHLDDPTRDETQALQAKDLGTTAAPGVIGQGRHFAGDQGIDAGDQITTFPIGAAPHSTELWFRAERSGDRIACWGSDGPKMMVQFILGKPPRMVMDCYGSGSSVAAPSPVPLHEWVHVVHTCQPGDSRVYVNGALDAVSTAADNPLAMTRPAKLSLGGWGNYVFRGDMDEMRVSKVARSADWVRLQYENQKPHQRLVGPLVQPGAAFATSVSALTLTEGQVATIAAQAGGARKIYWIIKRGGIETVAATDRFHFTLNVGRVAGDESLTLQCRAVFAEEVKTIDIPVAIHEALPDPIFALEAPATWDGRCTIEVRPQVSNISALQGQGVGALQYRWKVDGPAVISQSTSDRLLLRRALGSGPLTISCTASNGGSEVTQTQRLEVAEPAQDTWVERVPEPQEKPVDGQFYARGDDNQGTLFYLGALDEPADAVFLKLYADDQLIHTETQKPQADRSYALAVKLRAGLITYKIAFGTLSGQVATVRHAVGNLLCGDAYLIEGQSNAVGYNYENTQARRDLTHTDSPWIRSFGGNGEADGDPLAGGWGNARVERIHPGDPDRIHFISAWGMALAKKLVADVKIPICILNGAVGGTRIDEHLPRRPGESLPQRAIYENLQRRVAAAKLTHGLRGLLWHQGEADQGFDGPNNCFGCETYQQYWLDLTAAWKQDYPNLRHYYLFQIYPNACSQGGNRHSDKLREVQRQLSRRFASLSVMPTLHLASGSHCHFQTDDYEKMGWSMAPLLERDVSGKVFPASVAAPDLQAARFTSEARDEIALEFDQPMAWDDAIAAQFQLDGIPLALRSGSAAGRAIKLRLSAPSAAQTITYVVDKKWDPSHLLFGQNGIAALTFFEVPIRGNR